MQKCPKCGSTKLYNEISVFAKKNVNTGRVYGINKHNEDDFFEPVYCDKCGWTDVDEIWKNATFIKNQEDVNKMKIKVLK